MELNFRSMLWACWKSRDGQPQGTSHPSFNYGAGEAGAEIGALSQAGETAADSMSNCPSVRRAREQITTLSNVITRFPF